MDAASAKSISTSAATPNQEVSKCISYSGGMIQIEASYSKKLGLPNFSSHSFMISVRAEVSNLRKLQTESKRLYALLQSSVDEQVKEVGFMPDANRYGMILDTADPANGSIVKPTPNKAESAPSHAWRCSEKQRAFIEKIAKREQFAPSELDGIAQTVCQLPVRQLGKRQASLLIGELLKLSAPLPFRRGSKRQAPAVVNGAPV
jgi:hypothetical protein